jgi:hypothetical protein
VLGGVRCPDMFTISEIGVGRPRGADAGGGIYLLTIE